MNKSPVPQLPAKSLQRIAYLTAGAGGMFCGSCMNDNTLARALGRRGFDVQLRHDKLLQPYRWRKPRRIFVNSMSDLFHDDVPDSFIGAVFDVMAQCPQHTFQILTKRHARMRSLLNKWATQVPDDLPQYKAAFRAHGGLWSMVKQWPLPNVWLGVSTENQQWADIRIPALLGTPAAVRFISAEPLLGPIDLTRLDAKAKGQPLMVYDAVNRRYGVPGLWQAPMSVRLDWVIVGGESGGGARPMHPDWARSLRDQCTTANVPFLFKQWGEWARIGPDDLYAMKPDVYLDLATGKGTYWHDRHRPGVEHLVRVGKKAAGRVLDGRTWDQYPAVSNA